MSARRAWGVVRGPARPLAGDPELIQKPGQCWGITRLPGGECQDQGQSPAIDQRVGLGRQPTPGAPDGVIVRFVPLSADFD